MLGPIHGRFSPLSSEPLQTESGAQLQCLDPSDPDTILSTQTIHCVGITGALNRWELSNFTCQPDVHVAGPYLHRDYDETVQVPLTTITSTSGIGLGVMLLNYDDTDLVGGMGYSASIPEDAWIIGFRAYFTSLNPVHLFTSTLLDSNRWIVPSSQINHVTVSLSGHTLYTPTFLGYQYITVQKPWQMKAGTNSFGFACTIQENCIARQSIDFGSMVSTFSISSLLSSSSPSPTSNFWNMYKFKSYTHAINVYYKQMLCEPLLIPDGFLPGSCLSSTSQSWRNSCTLHLSSQYIVTKGKLTIECIYDIHTQTAKVDEIPTIVSSTSVTTPISVSFSLPFDCSSALSNNDTFSVWIKEKLSEGLNVGSERFVINQVACGSTIVTMTITNPSPSNSSTPSSGQLYASLVALVGTNQSGNGSTGTEYNEYNGLNLFHVIDSDSLTATSYSYVSPPPTTTSSSSSSDDLLPVYIAAPIGAVILVVCSVIAIVWITKKRAASPPPSSLPRPPPPSLPKPPPSVPILPALPIVVPPRPQTMVIAREPKFRLQEIIDVKPANGADLDDIPVTIIVPLPSAGYLAPMESAETLSPSGDYEVESSMATDRAASPVNISVSIRSPPSVAVGITFHLPPDQEVENMEGAGNIGEKGKEGEKEQG